MTGTLLIDVALLAIVSFGVLFGLVGAGTSVEHPLLRLRRDCKGPFGVQFNVSLNNRCSLTRECGSRCFINVVQPAAQELDAVLREQAIREIIDAGPIVRHLSFVEKEPFESPHQMRDALTYLHSRSRDHRPQAVGCITNGLLLGKHLRWLAETPLDWCLTSLDGEEDTHLRGRVLWRPSLENLLAAKRTGAARLIGINTVVTGENIESVVRLGRRLPDLGIDYWGVGVYMTNRDGTMTSSLNPAQTCDAVRRVADGMVGVTMPVVFELEEDAFELIVGTRPQSIHHGPWRLEHPIAGTPVRVATMSPEAGRYFRLRFDGQILDKADLLTVGVVDTRYGQYEPGKISRILGAVRKSWLELPAETPSTSDYN